jgi:hypothetical protein
MKRGLSLRAAGAVFFVSGTPFTIFCYAIPCDGYQRGKGKNYKAD